MLASILAQKYEAEHYFSIQPDEILRVPLNSTDRALLIWIFQKQNSLTTNQGLLLMSCI